MPPKPPTHHTSNAQFPSIQSFFPPSKPQVLSKTSPTSDGFTSDEVDAVLHPTIDANWLPDTEYEECEINELVPGPGCVMFKGRIANFYDQAMQSKKPRAAKGCVKLMVKDGGGCITVRLWYANLDYQLRLGQLVSIWTSHISNGEHGHLASSQAPLFTSIFPERDRSCHFMIHEVSDTGDQCKTPLGYRRGHSLPGLLTLQTFVDGGYDIAENKILVCVKSIGPKKQIPSKKGGPPSDCVNIKIFDSTHASASLTLWGNATASANTWVPSHTVLLLTNPGWRLDRSTNISLTSNTLVDVDPTIPDTLWLHNFASRLTRREDPNPVFPDKKQLDVELALKAINQILFTFSTLDTFARAASTEKFVGWLSVVITEISLSLLHRRNMLLCASHCGVPLYANTATSICKQCSTEVPLRLNPKILGPVVDETGCSQAGKLFLSDDAWEQLLGRSKEDLCETSLDTLRYLEQRIMYLRVSMGVAWWSEEEDAGVGRLWIWAVRM